MLAEDPANAEAAAYKGWMLTLAGEKDEGLSQLLSAATAHPDYPDGHAFLAIVFFQNGLLDPASRELDRLDELEPAGRGPPARRASCGRRSTPPWRRRPPPTG